jgi:hypothetical protein
MAMEMEMPGRWDEIKVEPGRGDGVRRWLVMCQSRNAIRQFLVP